MPATPAPRRTQAQRRTQAERRDATIGRLLAATVDCLNDRGYAGTTTAAICAEAGVSQGALFRYFPTRLALLVATAEHVAEANVEAFRDLVDSPVADVDQLTRLLGHLREIVLSRSNQTWRELLVAARSDEALREAMLPARQAFQTQMLTTAADLWGDLLPESERAPLLSLVVNFLDGLAFSTLDPTSEPGAPGRTVDAALALLAQMIVHRYVPERPTPQEN
ncbi:TetR/AcrR family transcriptional regulator [Nocardioides jishulii]|uniref:TetR/AcrR family transcriptional regulator n=1 Tax=Nocardioides jishulii TaxID=2575440 RepID=A0A4U2YKH4_9ACTN|nr:TetR/AcrR family transcriptional regulator [Nocardioides jishulii]QCX28258.1 TetR/AcrR family transcriptional regulator [Nocardioides jishulii]TKI60922.1 TetR/AcrR family transcriptional regulator [Nocardioides jishulii]